MKMKWFKLQANTSADLRLAAKYLAAVVAVITFILYLPALRCEFLLWDDTLYVFNNPHIRSLDLQFLKWAFTDLSAGFWHPLTWISYAIDYALWKLNPFGYHLTAITLHALNSFLVVILVTRLIDVAQEVEADVGKQSFLDGRLVLLVGGVTGILFGLHPLHVESVAWASERKDLLCALFFLWSLIVYVNYLVVLKNNLPSAACSAMKFNREYFLALFLFILALASKTMAVTLPIVFLLLDYYPFGRIKNGKNLAVVIAEKIPFFLCSLFISLISVFAQNNLGALTPGKAMSLYERTLIAFRALALYLWKMLVPLQLNPIYLFPKNISVFSMEYPLEIVSVLGVSAACIYLFKKKKKVYLIAWGYYLITLLPVIGFVPICSFSMADRFTYLPSLGPFLMAGLAMAWLWKRIDHAGVNVTLARRSVIALAAMYFVFLSVLLVRQINVWNNSVTFWSQVIEKSPYEFPLAYSVRGLAYLEMGMYEQAINDCNKAIMIQPDYPQAYLNRARVYMATGRLAPAKEDLDKAIAFDGKYADAYSFRGQVHNAMGNLAAAIADYTSAVNIDPGLYEVYNYRGIAFKQTGEYSRAIDDYNRTLAVLPDSEEVYNNRGVANRYLGRLDLAVADYSKAIAVNPGFALAYCNRGIAFKELKNYEKAIADFQKAKTLEPDLIKAYLELAECFHFTGRSDLALREYEAACSRSSAEGCNALQSLQQ